MSALDLGYLVTYLMKAVKRTGQESFINSMYNSLNGNSIYKETYNHFSKDRSYLKKHILYP